MDNGQWEAEEAESFCDKLIPQEEAMARIAFLNIGGLPPMNVHLKNQEIRMFVRANEVDFLGMEEMNVNWTTINNWNSPHE